MTDDKKRKRSLYRAGVHLEMIAILADRISRIAEHLADRRRSIREHQNALRRYEAALRDTIADLGRSIDAIEDSA